MTIQSLLEEQLREGLNPVLLKVINESPNHNVPEGSESHFHVLIVSEKFSGLNLLKRHQMVYQLVAKELKEKIHAFSQKTLTPEEFEERGGVLPSSPPCVKKSQKS
ncbi:MAG: BolA family transcriptional regulator [Oligoflexia bacterium]|nr:BolA family transcriptional regulator [Oligoflexia bacterium]